MTLQTDMNTFAAGLAQRLRLKPTARTANYTAAHRDHVFANTTAGAFTVTLPASPAVGDVVRVTDGGFTFDTNNLIVARNTGQTIVGQAANVTLRCRGQDYLFFWTGATWWPVRLSAGSWRREQFTTSGTFTPSLLLIAAGGGVLVDAAGAGGGGGGLGGTRPGGGGGGGELVLNEQLNILQASAITIGAGGAAGVSGGDTSIVHALGTLTLRGGRLGQGATGGPSGGRLGQPGGISTLDNTAANRGGAGGASYGRGGDRTGGIALAPEHGGGGFGADGGNSIGAQAGANGIVVIKWME